MKIQLILGSTRNGRIGERVATWIYREVEKIAQESEKTDHSFSVEFLDLKEWNLPMYQEPASEVAQKWISKIGEADGYIIVSPEYNHGYPAVLKNALDYPDSEWNRKAVGLVGYSDGMSAGIRSVEQLKLIMVNLEVVPLSTSLYFPEAQKAFDEDGNPIDLKSFDRLKRFLDELLWWVGALKKAREV